MKVYFAFEIFSILLFLLLDFASCIFYLGVFVWEVCNRDWQWLVYLWTDAGHFLWDINQLSKGWVKSKHHMVLFLFLHYYIEKGNMYKTLCHVRWCYMGLWNGLFLSFAFIKSSHYLFSLSKVHTFKWTHILCCAFYSYVSFFVLKMMFKKL